jgi:hypothetical protein
MVYYTIIEPMMGNLKTAIIATNAVLIALSSAAIACRIGRRVFLVRSFSWHDGELKDHL